MMPGAVHGKGRKVARDEHIYDKTTGEYHHGHAGIPPTG